MFINQFQRKNRAFNKMIKKIKNDAEGNQWALSDDIKSKTDYK
jgi:hypothetical protein